MAMLFILSCYKSEAQTVQRIFSFERGDVFKKETTLGSTYIIQRGKQKLSITSTSTVNKDYKITDVTDDSYTFNITIPKMDVVITAAGHTLHYNSAEKIDTTSKIERALKYMLNNPSTVLVDRKGEILSQTDPSSRLANDSLLAFVGIQAESFIQGGQFALTPNFAPKAIGIGYKWTDTLTRQGQKMKTQFWIDNLTPENTVIKFKSTVISLSINSNVTGTYVLDNRSGLVIQKLLQSISTGYLVLNTKVYATTRRISLSETCVKADSRSFE